MTQSAVRQCGGGVRFMNAIAGEFGVEATHHMAAARHAGDACSKHLQNGRAFS
jgi:hypothetical protein